MANVATAATVQTTSPADGGMRVTLARTTAQAYVAYDQAASRVSTGARSQ